MSLVVVGINHKTAPVEVRERFAFSPKQTIEANRLLKQNVSLEENLILSTCNRVEIYAVANHREDYADSIKGFFSRFHNMNISDYNSMLYVYKDKQAVEHLFSVAAGLDSLVFGETEILGQVKKAYQEARESCTTGRILKRLFEKSFNTAKRIKNETFIARGIVSVGSAAIRLAQKILGDLKDKEVLVVGTGTIGEQIVFCLKKEGIKTVFVANRTLSNAQELANRFSAVAISFEEFREKLVDVDIVITSTGAPHCIIHDDDIVSLMPKRKQKPLFIIDLAVPRDVESGINEIDNVYLYDIDDLENIVNENIKLRKKETDSCSKIINVATEEYMSWLLTANKNEN